MKNNPTIVFCTTRNEINHIHNIIFVIISETLRKNNKYKQSDKVRFYIHDRIRIVQAIFNSNKGSMEAIFLRYKDVR